MAESTTFPCPPDIHTILLSVQSFMYKYCCLKVSVSVKGKVVSRKNGVEEHGILADWIEVLALEDNRGMLLATGQWVNAIGGIDCLMQLEESITPK